MLYTSLNFSIYVTDFGLLPIRINIAIEHLELGLPDGRYFTARFAEAGKRPVF